MAGAGDELREAPHGLINEFLQNKYVYLIACFDSPALLHRASYDMVRALQMLL